MNKEGLRRLIIRTLVDREVSGYDIYKELQAKGVRLRTNYLYMILVAMKNDGLLAARWVENKKGPRKHLYSLGEKGQQEFGDMVRDSMGLIMDAFVHANVSTQAQDVPDHVNAIKSSLSQFGIPPPGEGDRFVYTTPSFDPLACYPLGLRVFADMFPKTTVFVVKPPGLRFYEDRPNLTFVDGRRHDIPLKDGFADYLMLEGFPKAAPESKTILECARVLKDSGHLIIRVPNVMMEENRPRFATFAEFALKQYYDSTGQDRVVSAARVRDLLSASFGKLMDVEYRGNLLMYAGEKKGVRETDVLRELSEERQLAAR